MNHILSRRSRRKYQIYFIEAVGLGLIKIGITADATKRITGMRTDSPADLRALLVVSGTARQEGAIHCLFSEDNHRNEWFRASDALLGFIEELKAKEPKEIARTLRRLPVWRRTRKQGGEPIHASVIRVEQRRAA